MSRVRRSVSGLALASLLLASPSSIAEPDNSVQPLHWFVGCWALGDRFREVWREDGGVLLAEITATNDSGEKYIAEHRRIVPNKAGGFTLTADPNETGTAVTYKSDYVSDREVVFVNPDNGYPQKITYYVIDGQFSSETSDLDGSGATGWNSKPCTAASSD